MASPITLNFSGAIVSNAVRRVALTNLPLFFDPRTSSISPAVLRTTAPLSDAPVPPLQQSLLGVGIKERGADAVALTSALAPIPAPVDVLEEEGSVNTISSAQQVEESSPQSADAVVDAHLEGKHPPAVLPRVELEVPRDVILVQPRRPRVLAKIYGKDKNARTRDVVITKKVTTPKIVTKSQKKPAVAALKELKLEVKKSRLPSPPTSSSPTFAPYRHFKTLPRTPRSRIPVPPRGRMPSSLAIFQSDAQLPASDTTTTIAVTAGTLVAAATATATVTAVPASTSTDTLESNAQAPTSETVPEEREPSDTAVGEASTTATTTPSLVAELAPTSAPTPSREYDPVLLHQKLSAAPAMRIYQAMHAEEDHEFLSEKSALNNRMLSWIRSLQTGMPRTFMAILGKAPGRDALYAEVMASDVVESEVVVEQRRKRHVRVENDKASSVRRLVA
ncbi:hypothetical protein BOTBODRAFT_541668 [Botryobasidium botryosum FD-172 SS1]|uniref:Uncharacterized protein n=1 Tax=Botryobasidium botryosum (strain FD-172 SS1) TaxID=930990 RepID=A0A067N279_BOTB1|nr:hypothetical protein BOTBODRAFT_541668 [Botryobasidium botryosum FD-172 SS1]